MVFKFSLHGIEDLSIPAGFFVLICNEAEGLPWRTGVNNQQTYAVTIGRIQDVGDIPDRPFVDFYLPADEYIPPECNSIETITTGACVGIKEVVKTRYDGRVDSADILDVAFVLTVDYLEKATPAVALGISNVFICRHQFLDNRGRCDPASSPILCPTAARCDFFSKNQCFSKTCVDMDYFDPTAHVQSALKIWTESGFVLSSSPYDLFPQDIWLYLSTRFEVQVKHRILMRSRKLYHCLVDRLAVEAMQLTIPSKQYVFLQDIELDCFRSVFGSTSTFGV